MKKMSLFAVVSDSILAAACAFALIFTAVRFYTKNPSLGLGLGCAAFVLFGALAYMKLSARRGKAIAFGKNSGKRKAFKTYLCSLDAQSAAGLIAPAFGGKATDAGVTCDGKIYLPHFTPNALSPNDICGEIAMNSAQKKVIVCNAATDDAVKFAGLFGVEIAFSDEIYDKLNELGALPESYPFAESLKPKLKDLLKRAVRRSNAGRLFWCGLWLTLFSYFTFFPVYYIVSGGIFLVLSAVCVLFGARD